MATKKTAMKATKTKALKRGTVGWLIEQLQKFPADMEVLHGDHDNAYYEPENIEILPIKEGYFDEKKGDRVVCIKAW